MLLSRSPTQNQKLDIDCWGHTHHTPRVLFSPTNDFSMKIFYRHLFYYVIYLLVQYFHWGVWHGSSFDKSKVFPFWSPINNLKLDMGSRGHTPYMYNKETFLTTQWTSNGNILQQYTLLGTGSAHSIFPFGGYEMGHLSANQMCFYPGPQAWPTNFIWALVVTQTQPLLQWSISHQPMSLQWKYVSWIFCYISETYQWKYFIGE